MPSVTRNPRADRGARRAETVGRLRGAAEGLIEGGNSFAEVSVEQLTKEAGISRSTFYVHFEDKAELLAVISGDATDAFFEHLNGWLDRPPPADREELRGRFKGLVEAHRGQATLLRALTETAAYHEKLRGEYRRKLAEAAEALAAHIEAAQRAGQVDAELDAARVSTWLVWMIERGLYAFVGPSRRPAAERGATALADIVWKTVYARSA